jgi:hypothetical protein
MECMLTLLLVLMAVGAAFIAANISLLALMHRIVRASPLGPLDPVFLTRGAFAACPHT